MMPKQIGCRCGSGGAVAGNGVKISLIDTHPILGYKKFTANDDNYLMLGNDDRVSANLILKAANGMGIRIYSNDETKKHCRILRSA